MRVLEVSWRQENSSYGANGRKRSTGMETQRTAAVSSDSSDTITRIERGLNQ
jgi:hypothetical protein